MPEPDAQSPPDDIDPAKVSVLIVNYESGPYLRNCLEALRTQTMPDFEAIIVDNGSSDGSLDNARETVTSDGRFRFIDAGENLGFAKGNNVAAEKAGADWLALLNPDAMPQKDWLERLLRAVRNFPDAVMFGSTQIDAEDERRLDGAGDQYFFAGLPWRGGYGWPRSALTDTGEVFGPCAAAALYRRDVFHAAGGFDERFFCYVEDVDLAFRLRLSGHRCVQVADAVVRHVGGGSSNAVHGFARFHGTRNMIWCFVKNMPAPLFWPLAPFHCAAMVLIGMKALLTGQGAAFRGIAAAVADLPWRERRDVQSRRTASAMSIASDLIWNPWLYVRRAPVLRKPDSPSQ